MCGQGVHGHMVVLRFSSRRGLQSDTHQQLPQSSEVFLLVRGETSCDRLSATDTIGHIWYLVYCDRVGGGGGAVKCQDIHDPSTVDAQPSAGTEKTHVSKEEGATSHDGGGLDKRKVS